MHAAGMSSVTVVLLSATKIDFGRARRVVEPSFADTAKGVDGILADTTIRARVGNTFVDVDKTIFSFES